MKPENGKGEEVKFAPYLEQLISFEKLLSDNGVRITDISRIQPYIYKDNFNDEKEIPKDVLLLSISVSVPLYRES